MNWIALKMLIGDRGKYLGLIFGIAFASLLIAQQGGIFVNIMMRTASFIYEMRDVDIWVMDKQVNNLDIIEPLSDTALNIVRSVDGVKWAVPLLKTMGVAKPIDGRLNQASIIGVDNASLVGIPRKLVLGHWENLRKPNAVIIDTVGYDLLWPKDAGHYQLGKTLELNDRRAVIVGIADTMPPFTFTPIFYTRFSNALLYTNGGRKRTSFILARARDPNAIAATVKAINNHTNFRAMSREDFITSTIGFYLKNTGIPVNFGVTVALGLIVAAVIVSLLLNMFVNDNIKQFGALKAMGVSNSRLLRIVLLQSVVVFTLGFSLGSGMAALFFHYAGNTAALKGFYLPWYILAMTAVLIFAVTILSSLFSMRRVLTIDPAIVFKG